MALHGTANYSSLGSSCTTFHDWGPRERLTTDWVDRVRGGMGCSASGVLQGIGLEKIMADKSPIRC